jgi:hypothetical protein
MYIYVTADAMYDYPFLFIDIRHHMFINFYSYDSDMIDFTHNKLFEQHNT